MARRPVNPPPKAAYEPPAATDGDDQLAVSAYEPYPGSVVTAAVARQTYEVSASRTMRACSAWWVAG